MGNQSSGPAKELTWRAARKGLHVGSLPRSGLGAGLLAWAAGRRGHGTRSGASNLDSGASPGRREASMARGTGGATGRLPAAGGLRAGGSGTWGAGWLGAGGAC